ncbi:MAG: glycoside hydrolase family 2 protein [Saccharofermentanales bacterium]
MQYKKLTDFKLNAYYQNVPLQNFSMETHEKLYSIFHDIQATVPGSIHADLYRSGIIKDPYYEMQSMDCEWVPERWWKYRTEFDIDSRTLGRNLRLRLCGIDYKAIIKLNGKVMGEHEGMYVPFVSNMTDQAKASSNNLEILLENAPEEMGQIGYTSRTHTQKARFSYKWDWCRRMIHLGLYDDVWIEDFGAAAIDYAHINPVCRDGCWTVECGFDMTGFAESDAVLVLTFSLRGDVLLTREVPLKIHIGDNTIRTSFDALSPELWNPLGHGDQVLYDLNVRIMDSEGLSDEKDYRTGFRTIRYIPCEEAAPGSLAYNILINDKKIYIKGVNLTPLDMMYGAVPDERYAATLRMARDANINLVRVWGGGLIEKEIFYRLCDELGIMVWQEFIQSSSGMDNVPSQNPEFLTLAQATAEEATKTRRNHVSLTFWSGGNELTDAKGIPSTFEDPNLRMMRTIVKKNNPQIYMLPTSASGPHEFLDIGKPGENHDVHGPWKYMGVTEQYRCFNLSDSQLHSEFGVDGYANHDCLRQFLDPQNLVCQSMEENIVLRHNGEWWDTYARDSAIFGPFDKCELKEFIYCSQFIQAEGLRYALEANRRRAFRNCGSIIWQFNEPSPNASGTNIIDYYLKPKFAYYLLRDAYRPATPSLRYGKLLYGPCEQFVGQIVLLNDGGAFSDNLSVTVESTSGTRILDIAFDVRLTENRPAESEEITFNLPEEGGAIVTLRMNESGIASRYLLLVKTPAGYADKKIVEQFYLDYVKE